MIDPPVSKPQATEPPSLHDGAVLQSFYDSAPMLMGVVDVLADDIRLVSGNAAAARFMGAAPGATHGKKASEIGLQAESIHDWIQRYQQAIDTRRPVSFEYEHRAPGSLRWLSAIISFIGFTEAGQARCSYIIIDITDRKAEDQRKRFLTEASEVLASSLDYETTLKTVAGLAVPYLADWCRIHLVNAAGVLELVTAMHTDPSKIDAAQESSRRYPPRMDVPRGPGAVFLSGVPQWTENVSEAMLRAVSHDEEHYRQLSAFGITSYLCVPLAARGKTIGTLTFFGAGSGHRYSEESLELAQELAARAAIAVDNARLYAEAQKEIRERQRAEMEISALNARLRRSVQETHHRVKNNLQIISALADLQMEDDQETVPSSALARIAQHTRSLAAVHDLLTQAAKRDDDTETISAKAALDKLIPLLQATTGGRRIRHAVEEAEVSVQQGAAMALLVSELISNAVKHGKGEIELRLTAGPSSLTLEVRDDGPGFPPDFDWQTAANTGIHLIESAGKHDLHGTISYKNRPEGGASVVVDIPLAPSY